MLQFIGRRLGVMFLTALCLTFIVFFLTNLYPNLEKLAKTQGNFRMSEEQVDTWLANRGYKRNMFVKYGEWLGVVPGYVITGSDGETRARCARKGSSIEDAPTYCGVLQGDWGFSTVSKENVGGILLGIPEDETTAKVEKREGRLGLTGYLMMWALILTIPIALLLGVFAGMREGSKTDRSLSTFAIATSATPEYVSGVVLIAIFASSAVGLKWFKGSAAQAMTAPSIENFTRLKGVSFAGIVIKHALRNALIAPFTIIALQIPYLLTGVVITETLFNYKGIGWQLVQAAGNNDIEMLLGVSVVSVVIVLISQLISDIGYVFLNPRIRLS